MENFLQTKVADIIVEEINLVKATRDQAEEFKNILLNLIDSGEVKIVVDLHQCEFVDSTFLSTLLIALKAAMAKDGILKIASPKSDVDEVLEATGMKKVFDVFTDVEEAVRSFT